MEHTVHLLMKRDTSRWHLGFAMNASNASKIQERKNADIASLRDSSNDMVLAWDLRTGASELGKGYGSFELLSMKGTVVFVGTGMQATQFKLQGAL